MKLELFIAKLGANDAAIHTGKYVVINGIEGADVNLMFPDRTPSDKLEAIAKAINAALKVAREIDGAGRD